MHCDQCEALMINGTFCHETGCPNQRKTFVAERGEWVLFVACRDCGYSVESGTACDCTVQTRYRNYYECPCGESWEDVHSCMCNDKCVSCGKEIEPSESIEIDA
jgi:hypothetical protein